MKTLIISCSIAAVLTSLNSYAERPLEEVIVTGNKKETSIFRVMGSASLISREDIEATQPTNFAEVLENQSGLQTTSNGGPGSNTSLFTRGTNSNHTLFLINGQRFSSATLGSSQFQFIDPEQIERVEIVRGSRSALYGSEAIGGVVQIFTRQADEGFDFYANGRTGTQNTHRAAMGANYGSQKFSISSGVSKETSDGIDNLVDDTGLNSDDDAYSNLNANLFTSFRFTERFSINLSHWLSQAETDFDNQFNSSSDPYIDSKQSVSQISADLEASNWFKTRLNVGNSIDDSDSIDRVTGDSSGAFKTSHISAYWQNDFEISQHFNATLGLDYIEAEVDSNLDYLDGEGQVVDAVDTTAVFTQVEVLLSPVEILAGVRRDDHTSFGIHETYSLSTALNISETERMYLSWNEGFKAPTFNDLYYPFDSGNPDLLPESSDALEWGLKGNHSVLGYQLSAYKTEIDKLIEWAPIDEDGFIWQPVNIDNAIIRGVELDLSAMINTYKLSVGFSRINAKNGLSGDSLLYRAKNTVDASLFKEFDHWNFGVDFSANSSRRATETDLPGYGVWGAFGAYHFTDSLSLKLKVNNIFDKDFQTNERYNRLGTNAYIKIDFKM